MFQAADGGVLLAEGVSMPGDFRLKRFDSTGPQYLHTSGFPVFSGSRSIEGNPIIVPLWFVAMLAFVAAFFFWWLPMKQPKPGFEVIGSQTADRAETLSRLPPHRHHADDERANLPSRLFTIEQIWQCHRFTLAGDAFTLHRATDRPQACPVHHRSSLRPASLAESSL